MVLPDASEPSPTDDLTRVRFHLHFEGDVTLGHVVPAASLARAVDALQRMVHLLGKAREGRSLNERLRVGPEQQRKYTVLLSLPESGGYEIPYEIGRAAGIWLDDEDIRDVAQRHQGALEAIDSGDADALRRAIPDGSIRKAVLQSIREMQPRDGTGLVVSIEDARKRILLNGSHTISRLLSMSQEPLPPRIQTRVVTGRLDGIDFQQRLITLHLPSGRILKCSYNDDFEPLLLDNPREFIHVVGEAVLDSDDILLSVQNVSEISAVDESPISLNSFHIDNEQKLASAQLMFPVRFELDDALYFAEGDFGLFATGRTRGELASDIAASLATLWREYVQISPDLLTPDALELRARLIETFGGEQNAA